MNECETSNSLEYLKSIGNTALQKKIIEILGQYGNTSEALDKIIEYVESEC